MPSPFFTKKEMATLNIGVHGFHRVGVAERSKASG